MGREYRWIAGRLLFGREPCMYRPCERDAVLLVAIPWVTYGSPPYYEGTHGVSVFPMCENHGPKERPKRKPKRMR